ncbi:PAS/PAC and GAF sensor-containing diguanylate cyclase/phosphodiesterase [Catenovulum agarivorans DS-2]|uniref:PAS/PAC and GAF sensor-containing diguanylate cyclase/phosphodiesterase n=2 Tax=Catenovulum agarivorans TaxID=1172192 RepID=W7QWQ7_9ALTE|nr:PAS/PAC and GAF sensor-containing diguanylate cyclase/phosphodiesterase [Catenovulum agarivorans DS-2]
MKALQRHIIFAAIGGVIFFILLGLASLHALDKWQNSYRLQIVHSQAKYVQQVFDKLLVDTQYQHGLFLRQQVTSYNPAHLEADFTLCFSQPERTKCAISPTSMPAQFDSQQLERKLIQVVDRYNTDKVGIVQLAKQQIAIVAMSYQNEQAFIQGYLLPHQGADVTVEPFQIGVHTNAYVTADLINPQAKWAIPVAVAPFSFYAQPVVWLAGLICLLSALMSFYIYLTHYKKSRQSLNRLTAEVSNIKANDESTQQVGSYQVEGVGELAGSINGMLEELFAAKEFNKVTLNSIGDAVITTDLNGIVTYCNSTTFKIIKAAETDIVGKHIADVLPFVEPEDSKRLRHALRDLVKNAEQIDGASERCMHRINRELEVLYIEKHITTLRNPAKELVGTVMVLRDMTQSERLRKKLNFQASYDVVTKLLNRHKFEEMLNESVHNAKMEQRSHVLCLIDLDRFKLINDSAGHAAGDQLLYEVGSIFRSYLRKTDVCARIGGDEYGIILFDAHLEHGLTIFEKILSQIKEYRFIWGGKIHSIGASFGITQITSDTHNAAEARREADAACYMAKNIGMNNLRVFDVNNEKLNNHHQAPRWAARINDALVNDKFVLFFQRINPTCGKSEREHIEILLRMQDKDGILLSPNMFLPAAERFRLTPKIDRWVIKRVFRWISSRPQLWQKVTLSVNLSGESLNDEKLFSYIIDLHEKIGFPPETICFEVTETAAVANLVVGRELITKLQAHGFTFALDDFGKGFSSYSYLQNLPAEYVKIDGGFVKQMTENVRDREIVRSIHQISAVMGMKTIAEYVEDDSILEALREIGVDYAQGFGIQKPAELASFIPIEQVLNEAEVET